MYIDPRIQGPLRDLIDAYSELAMRDPPRSFQMAQSAFEYAQGRKNEYEIAVAGFYMGDAEFRRANLNEAIAIWTTVKDYFFESKEYAFLAQVSNGLVMCYIQLSQLDEAKRLTLETLQLCEEHHFQDLAFKLLSNLSMIDIIHGNIYDAINTVYKMQDILDGLEEDVQSNAVAQDAQLTVYDRLAQLFDDIDDLTTSRTYIKECLDFALKNNLVRQLTQAYNNMAESYLHQDQVELSIEYAKKALHSDNSGSNRFRILINLTLSKCYLKAGRLREAQNFLNESRKLSLETGKKFEEESILMYEGQLKLARDDPEGITLLLESLELKTKMGDERELIDLLRHISSYYKIAGDFERSLQYYERYLEVLQKKNDKKQQTLLAFYSHNEAERREQEEKIYQLELEKKETKLQQQERELALTASQLAGQADLLSHFRNDLRKIVRDMADPIDALRHIKQKLKDLPCEQIDWGKFEAEFVAIHPEFRLKLHEHFPDLTNQETKMCMLARLGLKNVEIARLTCLSERSVENHRFNLRKKLGLRTEQNLAQFLATIK